jgi:hypothetical protein
LNRNQEDCRFAASPFACSDRIGFSNSPLANMRTATTCDYTIARASRTIGGAAAIVWQPYAPCVHGCPSSTAWQQAQNGDCIFFHL